MSYSLSFSKATLVVIFIADKVRQGTFEFLSTKMIAEVLDIPKPTLVKILLSLSTAGIIETREGKQGGVRLAKKPSQITILDIFKALEEGKPLFHTEFDILAKGKRPANAQKLMKNILLTAEKDMRQALTTKTIEQILDDMGS